MNDQSSSQPSQEISWVLKNFFENELHDIPIVTRTFSPVDLPNLHLAISNWCEKNKAKSYCVGYVSPFSGMELGLRHMLVQENPYQKTKVGPVQYRDVDIDVEHHIACPEHGIHLIEAKEGNIAAHVYMNRMYKNLELEVMTPFKELGTRFIEKIRAHMLMANVYRKKVISLECNAEAWGGHGNVCVRFHRFPEIQRENIILPLETMRLIENNSLGFFKHAELLRKSGRSVKRGILLHGKPGTGKTYTVKWLAQSMQNVTVIVMTGEQLWLIKECCQMARMLAPSLVILEDVDLIATQRDESRHPIYQVTLHQLLNEMDGIGSDAEVIFIMTTNRPDVIEPALAARPGRVDQAIEYPFPDADCRKRLFELYGRGLMLDVKDMDRLVSKTEGSSPAFIQELMRKAALIAAEENSLHDGTLKVNDTHLDMALRELVLGGGELTRNLLGFSANPP